MGTVKKYKKQLNNSFKSYKSKNIRSKGERLGWLSFEEAESVDLKKVLTNGEVVEINQDNKPLLVP